MESNGSPSVAAVVVHYRTPARLGECLDALERQTYQCSEIVVVDNSDEPGERVLAPDSDGRVHVHRAATNLGFGPACNVGARITVSDYLLFLNADLTLSEKACEELCLTVESNPRVATVGPRIYGSDGEIELSARSFPSFRTGVLGRSSLATRLLRRTGRSPRALTTALSEATRTVDWVSGACMLVHRGAFEDVGGFDENFWMYWEDADLCRRLADRGWSAMFCARAEAHHMTGSSGRSERTVEAFHASAARYYERHVARGAFEARLARELLDIRMRVVLRGHAGRG
jgi:N-acetylglucosaminyl-diphospho-decaprenol L-rhamnosyltransferase